MSAARRARLLLGAWLLREYRRADAHRELGAARDLLAGAGAMAFARRAELGRTGLGAPGPAAAVGAPEVSRARLTGQEMLVIQHVANGLTNKEIATALYLSPRTVDAHLRRVFRKLRITSRRQLRELRPAIDP
ncbi:helix-turn-helix transcriptional regulator [Streptosporangium canum]|uniref:helix-turn-helix transcriptional regulator n=1 Tax=Streptosporangium canum TaxID=324952 RepID=UPI00341CE64E